MIQIYYVKKYEKYILYIFMFCIFTFFEFLYSIISLFTSLLQHKISRSKPIARFSPGRVQPWKQGGIYIENLWF